jgi:muramidase (phage lysozyme)
MVIGNLFQINQDIIPKAYKGDAGRKGAGRKIAYIVNKLGHNISNNDWTTEISAYPIILESSKGTNVAGNWKNQQYPGVLILSIGSTVFGRIRGNFVASAARLASFGGITTTKVPTEGKPLLDVIAYTEGTAGGNNNGYDVIVGYGNISGWTETYSKGHPNIKVFIPKINASSSAAGRYQFLYSTWQGIAGNLNFNKPNQDEAGWKLINDKSAAKDAFETAKKQIQTNSIDFTQNSGFLTFLNKNYKVWASLPNAGGAAGYSGQGGNYSPEQVYEVYIEAVKKYM